MAFLSRQDSVVTSMNIARNPRDKDMSFEKEWSDATVESEIWRGKKLREKKPIPDPTYEQSVADIDFLGSFVKCDKKKNKYPKNKTNPSSPNSISTHRWRRNSADSYSAAYSGTHKYCVPSTSSGRTKTSKRKKCPMRIAELAVPSKRQCIDTWRYKSDILPQFMVERLKQHVLDQRPIVKIPEALICFQRRRSSTSKTRCKSAEKQRGNNLDLSKPCCHMDSRTLSIIFAHRIAKRLSKQMNLTLNADLERLSKIIHEDIAKLLCKCTFTKKPEYRAIHTDVSNKITIWITSILEDLSLKLLEEDLKELEEEEGPVLDIIDDLLDKVTCSCELPPVHVESESAEAKESETPKPNEMAEVSDIPLTPVTTLEETYYIAETVQFSNEVYIRQEIQHVIDNIRFEPEDYFRNEISNIIDNIHKESGDNTSDGSGDVTDKYISAKTETATNFNNADLADITSGIKGSIKTVALPAALKQEYIDKYKNSDEAFDKSVNDNIDITNDDKSVDAQNADEHNNEQVDGHVDETVEHVDESGKNDSNVSERSEILLEDSGDEKDNKKVKISHKDLVKPENIAGQYKQSATQYGTDKQVQVGSITDKPDIVFSAPNTNLLSNADEVWPAALGAKIKVSDSANKSISSLGHIKEIEEIHKSPSKSGSTENLNIQFKTVETESFLYKLKNMMSTEESDTETPTRELNETTAEEHNNTQIDAKTLDKRDNNNPTTVLEQFDYKSTHKRGHEYSKTKRVDYTESEILSTEGSISGRGYRRANRTDNRKPTYHKSSSLSDCGWRVQLHTAPSWVTSWGFGRGEPSDESIPMQIMPHRVTEADVRKWCKDLEKAYINLEMWSHWIHNTCKETMYILKQRRMTCPSLAKRHAVDWIKLRRNIHKDAILWTKLYKRTEANFKDLTSKYNNVEIVAAEYCAFCNCDRNTSMKQRK